MCEIVRRAEKVVLARVSTPWRARSIATTLPELTLLTVDGEPLTVDGEPLIATDTATSTARAESTDGTHVTYRL